MLLTRSQLVGALSAGSVPPWASSLNGDVFATVSREWVSATWEAGVRALRLNAPALVASRPIGASGETQLVPRYVLRGFNCRAHALFVYTHGLTGFACQAADSLAPLDHDALAFGFLHYTARPSTDNLRRDGRHCILWFVDHEGFFQSYEPGDGEENELTPEELASITFVYAQ
jgi:hypothetical protein